MSWEESVPENLRDNPVIAALGSVAVAAKLAFDELTVEVAPENIIAALHLIKNELKFEQVTTVTGVDRYPAEPRFEIVYHLHSFSREAAAAGKGAGLRR